MPERDFRRPSGDTTNEDGGYVFEGTPVSGTILLDDDLMQLTERHARSAGQGIPSQ
jgi:hypothetical protein